MCIDNIVLSKYNYIHCICIYRPLFSIRLFIFRFIPAPVADIPGIINPFISASFYYVAASTHSFRCHLFSKRFPGVVNDIWFSLASGHTDIILSFIFHCQSISSIYQNKAALPRRFLGGIVVLHSYLGDVYLFIRIYLEIVVGNLF